MIEKCDCLNTCGDDPRVHEFKVEPCECLVNSRKRHLAQLNDQLLLRKVKILLDQGRLPDHIEEYLQNSASTLTRS